MTWAIFAILGALFDTTHYALVKRLLKGVNQYVLGSGAFLSSFAVAFLFSLSSNFDKLVVKNSDPIFGSSVVYLLIGLSFLIISSAKAGNIKAIYKRNFHKFLVVGVAHALTGIATNVAFTMQIVPYVISLKRLSILFSVLLGTLVFRERNILGRISGASVMLAGVILIILS